MDPEWENSPGVSPYVVLGDNPIKYMDPGGDDWFDGVAGAVIGAATNVIPAGGLLRDLYTPTDSKDYNNALEATDNVFMAASLGSIAAGGDMMAGGGTVALAGVAVSATGVGAAPGAAMAAGGGATAGTGAVIAAGGAYLLTNSANNASQGYNRGKAKPQSTQPKQQVQDSKQVQQQTSKPQNVKSDQGGLVKQPTGPGSVPKADRPKPRMPSKTNQKAQYEKDGGKCQNCKTETPIKETTQHHYPKRHADGGDATVTVCKTCHSELHKK